MDMPAEIFRAYDIRGVVEEGLSVDIVRQIGCAIGAEAYDRGQQTIVVGRDGRNSGPAFQEALSEGLEEHGARRHRRRPGAHAGTLFRHPLSEYRQRCDGHRQPQSAGVQRLQDHARRRYVVRRRYPGAQKTRRVRRLPQRQRQSAEHGCGRRVCASRLRGCARGIGKFLSRRRRLRQRSRGGGCAEAVARAGARCGGTLLRGGWKLSQSPPGSVRSRQPDLSDRHREAGERGSRICLRRRRRSAGRGRSRAAKSSGPICK